MRRAKATTESQSSSKSGSRKAQQQQQPEAVDPILSNKKSRSPSRRHKSSPPKTTQGTAEQGTKKKKKKKKSKHDAATGAGKPTTSTFSNFFGISNRGDLDTTNDVTDGTIPEDNQSGGFSLPSSERRKKRGGRSGRRSDDSTLSTDPYFREPGALFGPSSFAVADCDATFGCVSIVTQHLSTQMEYEGRGEIENPQETREDSPETREPLVREGSGSSSKDSVSKGTKTAEKKEEDIERLPPTEETAGFEPSEKMQELEKVSSPAEEQGEGVRVDSYTSITALSTASKTNRYASFDGIGDVCGSMESHVDQFFHPALCGVVTDAKETIAGDTSTSLSQETIDESQISEKQRETSGTVLDDTETKQQQENAQEASQEEKDNKSAAGVSEDTNDQQLETDSVADEKTSRPKSRKSGRWWNRISRRRAQAEKKEPSKAIAEATDKGTTPESEGGSTPSSISNEVPEATATEEQPSSSDVGKEPKASLDEHKVPAENGSLADNSGDSSVSQIGDAQETSTAAVPTNSTSAELHMGQDNSESDPEESEESRHVEETMFSGLFRPQRDNSKNTETNDSEVRKRQESSSDQSESKQDTGEECLSPDMDKETKEPLKPSSDHKEISDESETQEMTGNSDNRKEQTVEDSLFSGFLSNLQTTENEDRGFFSSFFSPRLKSTKSRTQRKKERDVVVDSPQENGKEAEPKESSLSNKETSNDSGTTVENTGETVVEQTVPKALIPDEADAGGESNNKETSSMTVVNGETEAEGQSSINNDTGRRGQPNTKTKPGSRLVNRFRESRLSGRKNARRPSPEKDRKNTKAKASENTVKQKDVGTSDVVPESNEEQSTTSTERNKTNVDKDFELKAEKQNPVEDEKDADKSSSSETSSLGRRKKTRVSTQVPPVDESLPEGNEKETSKDPPIKPVVEKPQGIFKKPTITSKKLSRKNRFRARDHDEATVDSRRSVKISLAVEERSITPERARSGSPNVTEQKEEDEEKQEPSRPPVNLAPRRRYDPYQDPFNSLSSYFASPFAGLFGSSLVPATVADLDELSAAESATTAISMDSLETFTSNIPSSRRDIIAHKNTILRMAPLDRAKLLGSEGLDTDSASSTPTTPSSSTPSSIPSSPSTASSSASPASGSKVTKRAKLVKHSSKLKKLNSKSSR